MAKKLFLLVALTFGLTTHAHAQNKKLIDSLSTVFNTAKHDTVKIMALVDIAYEYRNSKPDTCIALATQALKKSEKIDFGKGKGWALLRIGVGNLLKGNFPVALAFLQQALPVFEKIQGKEGISNALNGIGNIYNAQSNYPLALEYYQKSLKIREEIGDKQGIGSSLSNIGLIYSRQGNHPLALEYHQKSLKIREEIGDKQGISVTLNKIGNIYNNQGNYPLALEYHQKSFQIQEEIGDKRGIINSLNGTASIYQKQKDYDKSIEYAQKSLQIAQEIKVVGEVGDASQILFETYKLKGDYIKALEYHELWKQTNDSLFNLDKSKALANLESRAEIEKKEKEIAIFAKDKELDKQKQEVLSKDLELQRIEGERQKNANLILEKEKEADRLFALARQEQDKRKQDSLSALAQKTQLLADNLKVNEQKLQAESKAKQLEILQEKEAKEFQQFINYLVLAGLLSVLVFAYFIFKSSQKEKRAKEEVLKQKEEVLQQKEEIQQINEELHTTLETVKVQKEEIEGTNERIKDSIRYAQRIQKALLPLEEKFAQHLGKDNFFVLHKPKDVVSGDFYFFQEVDNKLIIMAVDCTGHGVPGAFMSMIGINLLEEIILSKRNTNPAEILTLLHKKIRFALKQGETDNRDGMDLSIVVIDKEKQIMEFAGAKNAMIYIQNKQLYTLKADKMTIGGEQKEKERIFTKQSVDISQPTTIYLFTDGYQDQFGGKSKKKFMISQMREMFLNFENTQMSAQQNTLDQSIENWMADGQEKQIDDILVLGVKLS